MEELKLLKKYIKQLQAVALFKNMSSDEITNLLSHMEATIHTYQKDDMICLQNEFFIKVCIVLKGKLQTTKNFITNDLASLHILRPCDSFGEDAICAGHSTIPYNVMALENTVLLMIDGGKLFFMTKETSTYTSKFYMNIIKVIAKRSLYKGMQIDYIRITSLRKRVSIFLLDHYYETGQNLFTVHFNREEMANYLNVTRPALSKVLAELKKEDIIDYYKDSFKIKDIVKLREIK